MTWFPVLTLVGRLIVETGSPDALCPDLASAEEAIRSRLGELEAGDAANWRVRYTIGHAPEAASGDFVRLELYDPQAELRLSRDLPMAGESCATMARVIALVVDRFFRAMVAEHQQEQEREHAPAPSVPPAAREPAQEREPKASRSPAPARSNLTTQVGVIGPRLSPTLGLAFGRRTPYGFSLAAGLTWIVLPARKDLRAGGQAEAWTAFLRLFPAWDIELGAFELALGPTVALGGERGTTTGLPEADTRYRAVAAAGVLASLRLDLGRSLGLELSGGVEAPFLPFGGAFVVDDQKVLKLPGFRGFAAIGVGPVW